MIVFDSSALIRFFTNDDIKKASEVARLLESPVKKLVPNVVFTEIEYVLLGVYKAKRSQVIKAFIFLSSLKNSIHGEYLQTAISIYKNTKLDMADCFVVSSAIENEAELISYDYELTKVFDKLKDYP